MKKNSNDLKPRKMIMSLLVLVFIVILVSAYLYQSFQIELLMKDLHSLHQKKKQLLSETESLEAQVDRLSNIDYIARKAKDNFDLQFNSDELLVIKIDDTNNLEKIKTAFAAEENKIKKIKAAGIQ